MKTRAEMRKDDGNKCMKEGKHTEAVIHYTEAIKHDPNSAILHSNRSLAFLKIDQLFLAMEDAQKTIKLEPSWPKGFFRKGEIENKAGHYYAALMSYKQALLLDPTDDGISAAISRTNKELAKDKREASRTPIKYTACGVAVGLLIVIADQFLVTKPIITYTVLQILLISVFGAIGFAVAKIYRYLVVTQRDSLLEEPLDLLGEMNNDQSKSKQNDTSKTNSTRKQSSQSSGRQRMKKGKS